MKHTSGPSFTSTAREVRPLALAAFAALALMNSGCGGDDDSDPDPEPTGLRISGEVFYDGSGFGDLARPALQVAAYGEFPPTNPPNAVISVDAPDFSAGGIPYELTDVPVLESGYYVVAQIVDQDLADPTSAAGPTGAFPDVCQLDAAEGGVTVTEDAPTTNIDITLYDDAGADDPCRGTAPVACPAESGETALVLDIDSAIDPTASEDTDALVVALFENAVGGPPAGFRVLPRTALEFPQRVVFDDIAPADYVIYACYDRGGDNSAGLCDAEEDTFAFFDDETPVTLAADTVNELTLDIDNGDSLVVSVQTAEEAGCTN